MTNEEAIHILNKINICCNAYVVDRAITMAIKALEQEPCEDAISRSDAIRVASGYCHWSNIPKELEKLPSVNTEKTGWWEWVQYDFDPRIGNWHCSECRNIIVHAVKKDDVGGIPIAKYCPNCGARMEGVE